MDFKETCDLFGGTIFYDDFRGDLRTIKEKLDERLHQLYLVSLDDAASQILSIAIWHLLSGDITAATQTLDCLIHEEHYGRRWAFRAHGYTWLIQTWKRRPPLFRACRFDGPARNVWLTKNPLTECDEAMDFSNLHEDQQTNVDATEFRICMRLFAVDEVVRERARRLNPSSMDFAHWAGEREENRDSFAKSTRALAALCIGTLELQMPLVSAYLARQIYHLFHISGSPESSPALEQMRALYASANDDTGEALYWLTRGDHNASPAFASLTVLNFDISDGHDMYGGDSRIFKVTEVYPDPEETENQGTSEEKYTPMEAASICYDKADEIFARIGSSRGRASVALRQAACLIIEGSSPKNVWSSGYSTKAAAASQFLETAISLARASGDEPLAMVANVHLLLSMDRRLDWNERALTKEIGSWTTKVGNDLLGLCLGLLCWRQSLYFRYLAGSFLLAQASSSIAANLVSATNPFPTLAFDTTFAQANIWHSWGLSVQSSKLMEYLKQRCVEVIRLAPWTALEGSGASGSPAPEKFNIPLVLHCAKRAIEAKIAVDACVGDPENLPDSATAAMMELVRRFHDPITTSWIQLQEVNILSARAILRHKRLAQKGHQEQAAAALEAFSKDPKVHAALGFEARGVRLDMAARSSNQMLTTLLLGTMKNEDTKDQLYTLIGESLPLELERDEERRRVYSLELMFRACIKAEDWSRARELMTLLEEASPGYFTSVGSYTNLWPWQRCLYAGLVHEKTGACGLAGKYFIQSWLFLERVRAEMMSENERQMWKMPEVNLVFGCLARRAIIDGQMQGEPRTEVRQEPPTDLRFDADVFLGFDIDLSTARRDDVVMFLEASKTQYTWNRSKRAGSAEDRYKYEAFAALSAKQNRTPEEEAELQLLDRDKDEFLAGLMKEPADNSDDSSQGRNFFQSPRELYGSIPEYAVVIYTAQSQIGLVILVIDRNGVVIAGLNEHMTPAHAKDLISRHLDALYDREPEDPDANKEILEFTNAALHRLLIKPAERCIQNKTHVCFVLSGDFARVPVGALLYQDGYLGIQREVSQVPSLAALKHLRSRRFDTPSGFRKTVIARPGSLAEQNLSPERRVKTLTMGGVEALLIANLWGAKPLDAKDVDKEQFQHHLRDSNFLHICTHGETDADHSFNSNILLQTKVRVLDMLAVSTKIGLVTFSACLSSGGHISDAGDVQGFSHDLLAAGANAYIGALWKVNDTASMIHMYLFYLILLAGLDKPTFAEAWHGATVTLYNMSTEKTIEILDQFVKLWDKWEEQGKRPAEFVRRGRKGLVEQIAYLKTEKGARRMDFKHPYFWASFVLVGNGFAGIESSGYEKLQTLLQSMEVSEKAEGA
ncbi:CHAT domain-containing protein [Plectosphaerella cucumerina]|uniref:CHAT domain-containing protein n=1 Tax=Plectosphaerella cucumerina TaxID=40658 RepID=A0A8K0TE43_9PEZI|nr:CHAT domain-containing protein [Plectosphaerella cucumerina]